MSCLLKQHQLHYTTCKKHNTIKPPDFKFALLSKLSMVLIFGKYVVILYGLM